MANQNIKIAVAGTGYVGLSIATLLSQHHQVTAVDVVPEKVELINLYYGRWQYNALGGADRSDRVFRILLRLRDRIFFPEPDTPEKPR